MNRATRIITAGLLLASTAGFGTASADQFLGSYVSRISDNDKFASDGYALSGAAQMVRQDRANYHKFHRRDGDDENDVWFRSNAQRARLQTMLERGGMSGQVRRAIVNGEPLIQVDVYSGHVEVSILD